MIRAIDLFAGPGGWDVGAFLLGFEPLGVEWDDGACATRAAAGLLTLQADVAALDPQGVRWGHFDGAEVDLLIGSPPCQAFSMAGKGAGRRAMAAYASAIATMWERGWGAVDIEALDEQCSDPRAHLVLEPLRWVMELRPRAVALEQVEPVLPLWEAMERPLREMGYSTWTGVLSAEQYGTMATCPVHDPRPVAVAAARSSLTDLASVDPAVTAWDAWVDRAEAAARLSTFSIDLAGVRRAVTGRDIGSTPTGALSDVWAAATLARAALDAASDATWHALVNDLLRLVLGDRLMPRGKAGDMWLGTDMSESQPARTERVGSTASWLSDFWAELCALARWFTTSMRTGETMPPETFGCSSRTAPTCSTTGEAISRAECSLCDDIAVPQTRRRAILLASMDRVVDRPAPSHARYVPPRRRDEATIGLFDAPEPERIVVAEDRGLLPWVSMAEALGWDRSDRVGFPRRADTVSNKSAGSVEIDGVDYRSRDLRPASQPSFALTEKARSTLRFRATNDRPNATERAADEPAPALAFGHDPPQWIADTGNTRGQGEVVSEESQRVRPVDEPAPPLTTRADQMEWRLKAGTGEHEAERSADEPAPTLRFGGRLNTVQWRSHYDSRGQRDGRTRELNRQRSVDEPAPTIAGESRNDTWMGDRPATTVAGDSRVWPPGHKVNGDDIAAGREGYGDRAGTDAVRVTLAEALVLQSFPPDYPVQGTKTKQFEQVGNAIPPLLAWAVLRAVL